MFIVAALVGAAIFAIVAAFAVPGDDRAIPRMGLAALVLLLAASQVLDAMGGLELHQAAGVAAVMLVLCVFLLILLAVLIDALFG